MVIVTVLRAATPLVEGLLEACPRARRAVVSASRDEAAGRDDDGRFPIAVDCVKLPEIRSEDTVVADPMVATGGTMCAVVERVVADAPDLEHLFVLPAVAAPEGLVRVGEQFPGTDLLTVAIDERLDDDGFIVPDLGDAGDRAFRRV